MSPLDVITTILAVLQLQCLESMEAASGLAGVRQLSASPDYRYVALNWEYDLAAPQLYGFQVHFCEHQAWGPHRCRAKMLDMENINTAISRVRQARLYSVIIPGLRMATNYSFEVRPITTRRVDREFQDPRSSRSVVVATKGFSAKASLCLPRESEIEVATGPYFGGRIAVEAADGERCEVDGDTNSPRDVYTLRINHEACGSEVNDTTVATFVLVQENLPILTHSTRRFLVLCTYQPDTLTVRAKINLPSNHQASNQEDERRSGNRVDDDDHDTAGSPRGHVDQGDVDLQDHVQVMRLRQPREHTAHVQDTPTIVSAEPVTQLVLAMALIAGGVGGLLAVIWWSLRRARSKISTCDTESTTSCEESLRESEPSEIDFEIESVCESNENGPQETSRTVHM